MYRCKGLSILATETILSLTSSKSIPISSISGGYSSPDEGATKISVSFIKIVYYPSYWAFVIEGWGFGAKSIVDYKDSYIDGSSGCGTDSGASPNPEIVIIWSS